MAVNQQLLIDIGDGLSLMVGLPTIATWKNNNRPKTARIGTIGFNTQTKNLEYFDGSHWYAGSMESA
jgi:hypothetical protein